MFLHYWPARVAISGVVPREHRAQHIQGLSRIELSYATDGPLYSVPRSSAHKSSAGGRFFERATKASAGEIHGFNLFAVGEEAIAGGGVQV